MKYENPEIPEGINVTKTHPLKEMLILGGGALLLLVILSFSFGKIAGYLAHYIPFEKESAIVGDLPLPNDANAELTSYLNQLTERVTQQMDFPEGMTIQLHYSADDTMNAFATLGGNILLFRGLLEKLPHENALAMLIAHEAAHVKHRDPITGLGSSIAIQIFMSVVLGQADVGILGNTGLYTMLHFSRSMEGNADAEALETLNRIYGHTNGSSTLFEVIQAEHAETGIELPAFLQSHPLDQQRIDHMQQLSLQNGWSQKGEITPLPEAFKRWLNASEKADL